MTEDELMLLMQEYIHTRILLVDMQDKVVRTSLA